MPKYKTLDQHVVYRHQVIEPDTEVDVPKTDVHIWEELVDLKVAVRVAEPNKPTAKERAALEKAANVAEPSEGSA